MAERNMAEYIELDKVLECIDTPFTMSMCMTEEECKAMNRARKLIRRTISCIPAADVVESRHGQWIPKYEEQVKRLRTMCPEDYDNPMDFAYGAEQALSEAADAIEELSKRMAHGKWIPKNADGSWRVDTCSSCKTDTHYVRYAPVYDYCPNCGAEMRVEETGDV